MTKEKKAAKAAYMREYRKRNREKYKALDKILESRKKAKDPEGFLARAAERQRRYRERKKAASGTALEVERQRAMSRARNSRYYNKDLEKSRQRSRETAARLYAKNPEKFKAQVHRRRAVIEAGEVTTEQWGEIKARYGGKCAYCRQPCEKPEMDHVQPVTKGGLHVPENVVPACKPCNIRKGNKIVPFPQPD